MQRKQPKTHWSELGGHERVREMPIDSRPGSSGSLVNTCRDRVRKRRSRPTLMSISEAGEGVFPAGAEPADPLAATVAQDAIRRAFVRLNIDQRVVIAMRFYLDLEVDEIARRLGTRQGTIKSRLHRALKTLRDSWDGDR